MCEAENDCHISDFIFVYNLGVLQNVSYGYEWPVFALYAIKFSCIYFNINEFIKISNSLVTFGTPFIYETIPIHSSE